MKGTTFTVIAGAQSAAVHVVEGSVEVASGVSGQSHLIRPGRTITVSPQGGDKLTSKGGGFRNVASSARATVKPTKDGSGASIGGANAAKAQKTRLTRAVGQIRLNVSSATRGVVRNEAGPRNKSNSGGNRRSNPNGGQGAVGNVLATVNTISGNGGGNGGGNGN